MCGMIRHAGMPTLAQPEPADRVAAVRAFNRFDTQRTGVLTDGSLGSGFSLTQVRVLSELAHRRQPTASENGCDLGLDAGYPSRILRGFVQRGLLETTPSPRDAASNVSQTAQPRGVSDSSRHPSRHIDEAAGFRLVHEAPHHSFGHDLMEQTWELHARG
jgi:DNA-binding MarR family transcriptional regulator